MKFSAILAFGFAAVAVAQVSTGPSTTAANATVESTSSSTVQAAATATQSETAEQKCLSACARTDICCQAACVKVPCPNQAQANATTECAAACPQGNGTAGETEQYAACQSSCISSLFFATATLAPTGTAGGSAATATASGINAPSGTGSATTGSGSSGSASATASGSSSTSSTGAASHLQLGVTSVGILGLVIMGFAL